MAAPALRLFCDRKSHPSRAALLLLKTTNIPHEEVKLNLFRGEHWKAKELPFRKLPVLTHGNLTIAESTSILRYIGQLPGTYKSTSSRLCQSQLKLERCHEWSPSTATLLSNFWASS
jgi:glutathione S-transferase